MTWRSPVYGLARPHCAPTSTAGRTAAVGDFTSFDGIGELTLGMMSTELSSRGYVNGGNVYEGTNSSCVSYGKRGGVISASVDTKSGKVISVRTSATDPALHKQRL